MTRCLSSSSCRTSPEDGNQHDRQREEREEHVERDRRRVLRAAIAEQVLDRAGSAGDARDEGADPVERPAHEAALAIVHGPGHSSSSTRADAPFRGAPTRRQNSRS